MKIAVPAPVVLLVTLLVAGCQLPSAPSSPSGLRPIDGEITLGNVPVTAATATLTESVTGYDRGHSGQVVIESRLLVDACSHGSRMNVAVEVVAVDSSFHHIMEWWADLRRRFAAARIGQVWEYDVDLQRGSAKVRWTRSGKATLVQAGGEAIFDVLTKQSHFGGMTLRQDQEILRYRLGDLVPGLAAEEAELAFALQVVGRARFEDRPVVVVRSAGAVRLEGKPLDVRGIAYIDEATGISLYTDTRLAHGSDDSARSDIRSVQRLEVGSWADAAAVVGGKRAAGACGAGRSLQTQRVPQGASGSSS